MLRTRRGSRRSETWSPTRTRKRPAPISAFTHADGIRDDLERGRVSYGDAFEVQPFAYRLLTMTLSGAEIEAVLEEQWRGQPFPRILEVSSGLRYTWSRDAADGQRVDPRRVLVDGRPLELDRRYRVTVNAFLADGGNNFPTLAAAGDGAPGPVDVDALAAFVGRGAPVGPGGRIALADG